MKILKERSLYVSIICCTYFYKATFNIKVICIYVLYMTDVLTYTGLPILKLELAIEIIKMSTGSNPAENGLDL